MAWTVEEIERGWLGGQRLHLPADKVLRAFAQADQLFGREKLVSSTSGGWGPFFQVYWLGMRLQSLAGARGAGLLTDRLLRNDNSADSELTALHLLRSRRQGAEVEIEPEVTVDKRQRHPDFRIRRAADPWTYVEVTQLDSSSASDQTQQVLSKISEGVVAVQKPFVLELVLWRDPSQAEVDDLVDKVRDLCEKIEARRFDIGDLASVIVKLKDPAVVVPSILPPDNGTRMAIAKSIIGPDQINRQFLVRAPFADIRAEQVLHTKARQLSKEQTGLLMVDARRQPTAFESWPKLVPHQFTATQHTRVGGVVLFHCAMMLGPAGVLDWRSMVKMIPNPYARNPLPPWIVEVVDEICAEHRTLFARPD